MWMDMTQRRNCSCWPRSRSKATARRRGSVLRQIAVAEEHGGTVHLRVGVREVPDCDPLARVRDESNAVLIRGRSVGDIFLTGRGAGAMPTAAAILSDVIEIALLRAREEAWPRLRLA